MAFDTLATARRLREAGLTDRQAEVIAEGIRDLVASEIVTKSFLQSQLTRLAVRVGYIALFSVGLLAAIIKL
jgi:hypothetical protein